MQLTSALLLFLPIVAALPLGPDSQHVGGRETLAERADVLPSPDDICKKLNEEYDLIHDFDALTDSDDATANDIGGLFPCFHFKGIVNSVQTPWAKNAINILHKYRDRKKGDKREKLLVGQYTPEGMPADPSFAFVDETYFRPPEKYLDGDDRLWFGLVRRIDFAEPIARLFRGAFAEQIGITEGGGKTGLADRNDQTWFGPDLPAAKVYEEILKQDRRNGRKLKIVLTGFWNNIHTVLANKEMNKLFQENVDEVIIQGGKWPRSSITEGTTRKGRAPWNFSGGSKERTDAAYLGFKNWPKGLKATFVSTQMGVDFQSMDVFVKEAPKTNPLRMMLETYENVDDRLNRGNKTEDGPAFALLTKKGNDITKLEVIQHDTKLEQDIKKHDKDGVFPRKPTFDPINFIYLAFPDAFKEIKGTMEIFEDGHCTFKDDPKGPHARLEWEGGVAGAQEMSAKIQGMLIKKAKELAADEEHMRPKPEDEEAFNEIKKEALDVLHDIQRWVIDKHDPEKKDGEKTGKYSHIELHSFKELGTRLVSEKWNRFNFPYMTWKKANKLVDDEIHDNYEDGSQTKTGEKRKSSSIS